MCVSFCSPTPLDPCPVVPVQSTAALLGTLLTFPTKDLDKAVWISNIAPELLIDLVQVRA